MFSYCGHLETIYAGNAWSTDSLVAPTDVLMFYGCTSLMGSRGTVYDENFVDATRAHIDGGRNNPGYLSTTSVAYAVLSTDFTKLTFYFDTLQTTREGTPYLLNKAGNIPGWNNAVANVTHVQFDTTFVDAYITCTNSWFSKMSKLDTITGIDYLETSSVTDMRRMFSGCQSLSSVDLSGFNTMSVASMWAMFADCESLTSLDLSSFSTPSVTNMARMFSGCKLLKSLDLSGFNTASVTDMAGMFADCASLTSLDLSRFNTTNVKYMSWMFAGCNSLTSVDMRNFNTPNVKEMQSMFMSCTSLESIDLSRFNTLNVREMGSMFQGCSTLSSLDLKSFKTSSVQSMNDMFNGCDCLESIYVGNGWTTDAVTRSGNMFLDCISIVGGQGTTYDENHVDAARAHIDGGPDNPGYFTGSGDIDVPHGDVNGDGEVNITDVNCIISVILGGLDIYEGRADVDADGEVIIADINAVIRIILGN